MLLSLSPLNGSRSGLDLVHEGCTDAVHRSEAAGSAQRNRRIHLRRATGEQSQPLARGADRHAREPATEQPPPCS